MSNNSKKLIPSSTRNLYIDIGNSAVKICYTENGRWVSPVVFPRGDIGEVLEWLADLREEFQRFVVSSVVQHKTEAIVRGLGNGKNYIIQSDHIPEKFIEYRSVKSLGIDRFLAGLGAWSLAQRACVVIDAGTACTADYVNGEGVFEGGVIMPGLKMLEKAMSEYTPELPEVDRHIPDNWPGKTTEECLQWGITGTFIDGITRILDRYESLDNFDLYLTGGDASDLNQYLDRSATVDNKLIFRGMKYFVDYLADERL
jgi:type III pantothenate kinase